MASPAHAAVLSRVQASRLFVGLPPETQAMIAAETTLRRVRPRQLLWREGETAEFVTILLTGLVEVVRSPQGGEEALLGVFGPREVVGLAAALEGGPYPAHARALTPVGLLQVRATLIRSRMERDVGLAMAVNRALLDHTRALRVKIDVMSAGAVPFRLAAVLRHLCDRFGDEDESGCVFVPIPLTRVQLARMVGARVETVSRILSRWQREGVLLPSPRGFRLPELAALEREGGKER